VAPSAAASPRMRARRCSSKARARRCRKTRKLRQPIASGQSRGGGWPFSEPQHFQLQGSEAHRAECGFRQCAFAKFPKRQDSDASGPVTKKVCRKKERTVKKSQLISFRLHNVACR